MISYAFSGVAKFNSHCCGYGTKATNTATGYDCALIPSATHGPSIATKSGKSSSKVNGAYGFCGGELGTASASIVAKTICCELTLLVNSNGGHTSIKIVFLVLLNSLSPLLHSEMAHTLK